MVEGLKEMITELKADTEKYKQKYQKKADKLYKERNKTPEEPIDRSVETLEAKLKVLEEQAAWEAACRFAMRDREI